MPSFLEILILSTIQGITEFLPISSAAHLVIISEYYSFGKQGLLIDICLHLGSLIAIIFYFKKDLIDLTNNKKFLIKILIGTIPIIPLGYIFYKTGLIEHTTQASPDGTGKFYSVTYNMNNYSLSVSNKKVVESTIQQTQTQLFHKYLEI